MTAPPDAASQTLLWHDYETFGRSARADRPAQFAAVRTDLQLNEIGEPLKFYCQPTTDYLPDPGACLLTGITPQMCLERGLPETEFAARIEQALARPGTIGVGYNSIRFDDEVTRHLFWRNLIDPYAREWRNGCGRWDLLDLMRTAHALRPDGIDWPKRMDGSGHTSFRLGDLTAANGITHDAAHDALSDTRATLALARLVRQCNPKLFDFCFGLRDKMAVAKQLGLPVDPTCAQPFLHVSGMFPAEHGHLAICFPLAMHPTNRNELIAWDLRADPSLLATLDAATIRRRLFTRADELMSGETRLPIKTVRLNRSPIVIGNVRTLQPQQAARWNIDTAAAEQHAEAARGLPDLQAIWQQVFERPAQDDVEVEQDLYAGLVDDADRRRLDQWRTTTPERLSSLRANFDDPRLPELSWRWRARNFPQTLSEEDTQRWRQHCAACLIEGAGGARTLDAYFAEIDVLAKDADPRGEEILGALYDWAEAIAPEAG
ncbi:MAG: exodeoxyribonuclease I [Burkholderiales bacterium]